MIRQAREPLTASSKLNQAAPSVDQQRSTEPRLTNNTGVGQPQT
jgi:hypothetical protein